MSDTGVIIGLDIGRRRTGIARADGSLTLASPVAAVETEPVSTFPQRLRNLLAPDSIQEIVMGLPLELRGTEGETARFVRSVAEAISESLNITVTYIDERFTTKFMDDSLKLSGRSVKRRNEEIDMWAAVSILQTWLDQQKT